MPEARDRLERPDYNVVPDQSQRRIANTIGRGRDRAFARVNPVRLAFEEDEVDIPIFTPYRWRGTAMAGTPGPMRLVMRIDEFEARRIGPFAPIIGNENLTPIAGRGRARGSPLPPWFPRIPLNDITTVVRAIENTRRDDHHHTPRGGHTPRIETPITLRRRLLHTPSASGFRTPRPVNPCPPSLDRVKKILKEVTNVRQADSEGRDEECNLTPQKRLLDSLDAVEEAVKEEIQKLKRMPSAKRLERQKRVRTLMSMR